MEQLFLHPGERQAEIEALCEGRFPRFGYATLASLIADERGSFNVVLTTNFDDLIADSLYLFTRSRPLVIQHASLSEYIRPTRTRPLLVKVHGDYQLAPLNTVEETKELEGSFNRAVQSLLHDRGLIFLGYGGGDPGILRMLESLSREALPFGVYWVSRKEPIGPVRDWLETRNAVWVEYPDFDQFMVLLRSAFDLPKPDEKRFEEVFRRYAEDYESLSRSIRALPDAAPSAPALKEAVRRTDETFAGPWSVLLEARRLEDSDPEKAQKTYQHGIEEFPKSSSLLGNFANFLSTQRKDFEQAEEYYQRALKVDPTNAANLANYANFLATQRKDFERAEEYYHRALATEPTNAYVLGNYAWFPATQRKDFDRAEEYYQRALTSEPTNALVLGRYAWFLATQRKDLERAEEYYQQALEVDPTDATNLGSYAGFLATDRKDLERAEEYYHRALDTEPTNGTNLRSYAWFLSTQRKDFDRAEEYYQRAMNAEPTDAYVLSNYALFLHHDRKDLDRAEEYHRRALESEPTNANYLGNYAGFLDAQGRYDEGLKILEKAFSALDANAPAGLLAELWFYVLAHHRCEDRPKAVRHLRRLIDEGARSPNFDLSSNVARARIEEHPDAEWLSRLAMVISTNADASTLSEWHAWKEAANQVG
jgi:Tfp pilus assembly protein PilF